MAYRQSRGLRAWGLGAVASPTVQSALAFASASSGVPLSLLQSLAATESSNNPAAVSSKGAQGLLQLMPGTAAQYGVSNPFDPAQNAAGGAAYLKSLYDQYGDWQTALIAYNEGPGNLSRVGPFASSQAYASQVLAGASLPSPLDTSGGDTSSLFDLSALDTGYSSAGISPLTLGLGLLAGLVVVFAVT